MAAQAQQSCAPTGDVRYVCGPKNPEDLVLVPGTQWIVSSGMADGAGFYLVDSRAGTFSTARVHCGARPAIRKLRHAADGADLEHSWPQHSRGRAGPRAAQRRRPRRARSDRDLRRRRDGRAADADMARLRGDAGRPRGEQRRVVSRRLALRDGAVHAGHDVRGRDRRPQADGRGVRVVARQSRFRARARQRAAGEQRHRGVGRRPRDLRCVVGPADDRAFSRSNPARQLRTTRPLGFTPDNVHLAPDGKLVTAGMANDVPECGGKPGPAHDIEKLSQCPRPTIAVAIDPATMRDTVIATTTANAAFSNATMVLPVGRRRGSARSRATRSRARRCADAVRGRRERRAVADCARRLSASSSR